MYGALKALGLENLVDMSPKLLAEHPSITSEPKSGMC